MQGLMRLVMMGTGPFAVPTFRALFETRHAVAALVTQPSRAARGRPPLPLSPMRKVAEEHGVAILDPEDVNTDAARAALAGFEPELFVVCDYGQILASETLGVARLGGINLHGSLLPKYRGAAPINWAVFHGDAETGVTVIHMTPRVDAGPSIVQARTPIDSEETAVALEARLAELGAPSVLEAIELLERGPVAAIPQDPSQASRAPRLKKSDGLIDWSRTAAAIKNQVRAMEPWPKTYTFWRRPGSEPLRLILGHVAICDAPPGTLPGTVLEAVGRRLVVVAGAGALAVEGVQPAGKRLLSTEEFLRGYPVQPGQQFGPEGEQA
ncbi:MAG: methionyl-tRNA formyltransferase [Pirellulales bacterium]